MLTRDYPNLFLISAGQFVRIMDKDADCRDNIFYCSKLLIISEKNSTKDLKR